MNVRRQFLLSLLAASLLPHAGGAQGLPTDVRQAIGKFLDTTARKEVSVGRISIDSVAVEGNTLQLFANMNCAYIPFREDNVAEIYQGVSALLPVEFAKYKLQIRTNKLMEISLKFSIVSWYTTRTGSKNEPSLTTINPNALESRILPPDETYVFALGEAFQLPEGYQLAEGVDQITDIEIPYGSVGGHTMIVEKIASTSSLRAARPALKSSV